ncbi:MAG: CmcJ/NvfI family oxidoreductase [Pseudomonadales bacterium]
MKPSDISYCQATLNYSNESGNQPVSVNIGDGRAALDELDYESCGFTLLEHRSAVTDWGDESQLRDVHIPEIESLARAFTGCDRAAAYPALVRSPLTALESTDYAPIQFVHSDYSDDYRRMIEDPDRPYHAFLAPTLERAGLSQQDIANADRVLMLQFWRNIGAERPDYPFALCDAATVPRSQLYAFTVDEYAGTRLEFEVLCVTPPADPDDHHWYTFPGLQDSEVIAFRTYDSRCADENEPFWTPHSAFRDSVAGPDAPQRESLEMRVLCLFGV